MSASVPRSPDVASEARLLGIRREAERQGRLEVAGVRPPGAPFPQASPEAGYYGLPLLKRPAWTWQVPLYFFIGGATGAAGVIGAMADWVGRDRELARHARLVATGGALLSSGLLIGDLGRPDRFLSMLRVFKRQSPMSVGAWVLAAFGSSSGAAVFARWLQERLDWRPVRVIGNIAQFSSAVLGLPLSNYTGVLIGATAIPVWNENVSTLPLHFGMSGLNSGVGILELLGHNDSRALNLLGILAAAVETWEGFHIETSSQPAMEPLKRGVSGRLTRIGGVLSGPLPLALRLASVVTGSRRARRRATYSSLVGSLITRFAWMLAGHASAKDYRLPLEISQQRPQQPAVILDQQAEADSEERLAV